jgi:signal peptidase I
MPGDTLLVDDAGYKINGRSIPYSPTALKNYFVSVQSLPQFYALIKELNIPVRNLKNEPYGKILSLTELEEKSIRDRLSAEANKQFVREQIVPYKLIIPKKGKAYRITESSLMAGEDAILSQIGEGAEIKDRKLFVDGKQTDFVFFDEDYYWMLSDNANEAIDSRHLGFVPESSIIGNVFFVWYSRDKDRRFKKVN